MSEMNEVVKSDIVMLYSGGADSLLMLHLAKMAGKIPHCVLVDYGQKHIAELDFAMTQLERLGVTYQIVKVEDLNVNSGLTGSLSEGRWENVHEMNVPARNSWFLTLAASVAENMGIDEIWIGCDMSDYYGEFPDCKQEYIGRMNKAFEVAFVRPISIIAPLLGMTKELIVEILEKSFGIRSIDMYSGYVPPESRCTCGPEEGCNNCLEFSVLTDEEIERGDI
jgi:7-cyano-7-deazaguanine synthase